MENVDWSKRLMNHLTVKQSNKYESSCNGYVAVGWLAGCGITNGVIIS